MQVTLLAFASAAQHCGWREYVVDAAAGDTPRQLFARVVADFQAGAARAAVNEAYHDWDAAIGPDAREVAILPPVSGG